MNPTHRSTAIRAAHAAAWAIAFISVAACTEAGRKRDKQAAKAAAPAASAPAPPAAAPAAPQPPAAGTANEAGAPSPAPPGGTAPVAAATAVAAKAGLDPAQAKGKVQMQLTVPGSLKLGGFEFAATYDADRFHVAEPTTAPSMQGYMCQANLGKPGVIRFNCAGLVPDARGGLVATFDISYADAPPTAADFTVTSSDVVDDLARRVEGTRVQAAFSSPQGP